MESVTEVAKLQGRLNDVERRVYGDYRPREVRAGARIADGLVKVQSTLANIAGKRERIKILYKKIEDLKKYLDPQYIDRILVPDAMKLEFILAEEQYILDQAALLEQLSILQPYIDSVHIKAVPGHTSKLQNLSQIQIQQQDRSDEITEETKRLLEDYNKMTESCCRINTASSAGGQRDYIQMVLFHAAVSVIKDLHGAGLPFHRRIVAGAFNDRQKTKAATMALASKMRQKGTVLLSKQFVQWDEMLAQMEAAKKAKRSTD